LSERPARWQPPDLETPAITRRPEPPAPDYAALEARARQAGYDAGYAEGLAAGRGRGEAILGEMSSLWQAMAAPLAQRDETLVRDLAGLVARVARAVVRAELSLNQARLDAVLEEALACMDGAQETLEIRVHPEDAALLRDLLEARSAPVAWRIEEAPELQRGGLQLATPTSFIDASVERELDRVCEQLLERAEAVGLESLDAEESGEGDEDA
jgi:flagellar assembly protein FliH